MRRFLRVGEVVRANIRMALVAMRTQGRTMRGSPSAIILGIVQPVVFLLIAVGTQRARSGQSSTDLVVGVGLTALWASTIWSAGGILRNDMYGGTLARWLTGVGSPSVVFLGRCLGATIRTTGIILVSTVATAAAVGLPVQIHLPGLMMLGFVLVLLSVTALGMVLSCLFLVTRHATAWSAALMYPVFIISGMIIPLDVIPAPLRVISTVISLHWGEHLLANAAGGTVSWSALAALVGLMCLYFVLAVAAFRWFLHRARREGHVDHA